jgi:site-specific DNA-methyltransferase (adenine-specific)
MTPYYEQSGITIFHGDCCEVMASFPSCFRVDVTVTDPPYGVGLTGKLAKKRGGGQTFRPGAYGFEDAPEYVRSVVVPVIEHCRRISDAVVLTPGTRNLWMYPQPDDLGCFFSAAGTGVGRWGFTCSQPILFYGADPYLAAGMGSRANSHGQTYPNDANFVGHPCAKPLPMWRWLVGRSLLPGMTILDPFMGSGTTLVAAKPQGCKAIGIEIEERYCEIAARRLQQEALPLEVA